MARKRDTLGELLNIKTRNKESHRIEIYFNRWNALSGAFKAQGFKDELLRYFPIGAVACLEAYFRAACAELLDKGEPYSSRAEQLAKDLKLDWRSIRAVEGRAITSGEVLAHSLSLNNLGDIQRVMNALLETDFLSTLRDARDGYVLPFFPLPLELDPDTVQEPSIVLADPDKTFRAVARTFELRHIFCHESAASITVNRDEIGECLHQCRLFLKAADETIWRVVEPNPAHTQQEMTDRAAQAYRVAEAKVNEVVRELEKMLEEKERRLLDQIQDRWRAYVELDASLKATDYEDGTMHPMIRYRALEEQAKHRADDLLEFVRSLSWLRGT